MIRKIKDFIDNTSADYLIGGSNILAIFIGYLGYASGFDSTETGLFVSIGVILITMGIGFAFSIYKKEYPIYFRARLRGKSAQIFGAFWLIVTWGTALFTFLSLFFRVDAN